MTWLCRKTAPALLLLIPLASGSPAAATDATADTGAATAITAGSEMERVTTLAAAGFKSEAIALLQAQTRANPSDQSVKAMIARLQLAALQPLQAAETLRELCDSNPDDRGYVAARGEALLLTGQREATARLYRSYLTRNPSDTGVSRALGEVEGELAARETVRGRIRLLEVLIVSAVAVWIGAAFLAGRRLSP